MTSLLERAYRGPCFTDAEKRAVFWKGWVIPGYDPNEFRRDRYGYVILYSHYGRTESLFGWEVDHIIPVSHGGGRYLANLQPLQWRNNKRKSDALPAWWRTGADRWPGILGHYPYPHREGF